MATALQCGIDQVDDDESSYHDVLVIGRTGQGKSTVANILLGIDPNTKTLLVEGYGEDVIKEWGFNPDGKLYFEIGTRPGSVTDKCKVLSNERSKDRILDTRGLADSRATAKYGVVQGNIQSFRWVLQAQKELNICFSRVLYFLPNRGPLEKADGYLQEEIEVMYNFFGQRIFDIMVIALTQNKDERYQKLGFSQEEVKAAEETFLAAFHAITGCNLPQSPPAVYIPVNVDQKTTSDIIVGASVISDAEKLTFSPEFPMLANRKRGRGVHLYFENCCTRCGIKIEYEQCTGKEKVPVRVVSANGDEEVYDNSYCHPLFIPKYSRLVRVVGGIWHIVTLGVFKAFEKLSGVKVWPGFFNWEEECIHCKGPPGSPSCYPVTKAITVHGMQFRVDHTTKLDTLKCINEEA